MFSLVDERIRTVQPPNQYIALKSGRDLSNYVRPHTITENIKEQQGFKTNEQLRKFLQTNADKLIQAENNFWQNNMKPWN